MCLQPKATEGAKSAGESVSGGDGEPIAALSGESGGRARVVAMDGDVVVYLSWPRVSAKTGELGDESDEESEQEEEEGEQECWLRVVHRETGVVFSSVEVQKCICMSVCHGSASIDGMGVLV